MRLLRASFACGALFCFSWAQTNFTSRQILPSTFKPLPHFQNVNLLRSINLDKGYVRETVNIEIENIDKSPQSAYYIPFPLDSISKVGGLTVRDKKDNSIPAFRTQLVEYDPYSSTQFFLITLPTPLAPKARQTLAISYHLLSSLSPRPAKIKQDGKQYLAHTFSTYWASAYTSTKQKTKIKFPNADIPDANPAPKEKQGSTFTYGPYDKIPAGSVQEATVRYEFTKPVTYATLLERDIEVSQWGGNLATEERYWLTNQGAHLQGQFSRVTWATQHNQYNSAPTSALVGLKIPLKVGSMDAYFIDDIGNVSTSRFRSNQKEALLEAKPRYPVFGGWNYSFRVGWNSNVNNALRRLKGGDTYILRVPFVEGPKNNEGASYGKVVVRIILPEGAVSVTLSLPFLMPVLINWY